MTTFWHKLAKEETLKINPETYYRKTLTGEIGVTISAMNTGAPYIRFSARIKHSAPFINEASKQGFDASEAYSVERLGVVYPGCKPLEAS